MAGSISLGNKYTAAGMSVGAKSVSQRLTISNLTNTDVLDTNITLPKGACVVSCAMKVIKGPASSSAATLALGLTGGTTNGFLTAASVLPAAEGAVYNAGGAYVGASLAAASLVSVLAAVTTTATSDTIVDIEIVYFATSMA